MEQTTSQPRGTVRGQHGPIWGFLMRRAINPVMQRLLGSRFHRRIGSEMIMVLTFRGRRSGKEYTFPIGYMQQGSELICYSPFGWWRNLEGGAPVTVTLRGQRMEGRADVCTDTATIASGMVEYLRHNPGDAFFFRVKVVKGEPVVEDVERAARENVQIRIALGRLPDCSSASGAGQNVRDRFAELAQRRAIGVVVGVDLADREGNPVRGRDELPQRRYELSRSVSPRLRRVSSAIGKSR